MKNVTNACLAFMLAVILVPALSFSGAIKATATPMVDSAAKEQALTVPVTVDISSLPEKLGSYTATLTWDSHVLQYVGYEPGTTMGFSAPVVNSAKTGDGLLTFAAANPYGADGTINILNVQFQVIGAEGSQSDLKLDFSAMAAAKTFTNLLPFVQTLQTGVERGVTVGEPPKEFALLQNYPNPFNPTTKIGYSLPKSERVQITIYNELGQIVRKLVDEFKSAGNYAVIWDSRDGSGKEVPVGLYLFKLQAGNFTATKKMHLLK